jgi:hypothetical protein
MVLSSGEGEGAIIRRRCKIGLVSLAAVESCAHHQLRALAVLRQHSQKSRRNLARAAAAAVYCVRLRSLGMPRQQELRSTLG